MVRDDVQGARDGTGDALFTASIVLLPVLGQVGSPVPGVGVGDLLVLAAYIRAFLPKTRPRSRIALPGFFLGYVVIMTLGALLSGVPMFSAGGSAEVLLRLGRFTAVMLPLFASDLTDRFDAALGFKVLRIICLATSLTVIVQWLLVRVGFILPNPISFVTSASAYRPDYYQLNPDFFRPSGLFLEPAHMAVYCVPFLIWLLFGNHRGSRGGVLAVVVIIGVALTGSGIGILACVGIVAGYAVTALRKTPSVLFLTPLVILIGVVGSRTAFGHLVLDRIFGGGEATGGSAATRLTSGYDEYSGLPWSERLFGAGFGNVPSTYMNGAAYMLWTLGLVGTMLFVGVVAYYLRRVGTRGKLQLVTYVVFLLASQMFNASALAFNVTVALSSKPPRSPGGREKSGTPRAGGSPL